MKVRRFISSELLEAMMRIHEFVVLTYAEFRLSSSSKLFYRFHSHLLVSINSRYLDWIFILLLIYLLDEVHILRFTYFLWIREGSIVYERRIPNSLSPRLLVSTSRLTTKEMAEERIHKLLVCLQFTIDFLKVLPQLVLFLLDVFNDTCLILV